MVHFRSDSQVLQLFNNLSNNNKSATTKCVPVPGSPRVPLIPPLCSVKSVSIKPQNEFLGVLNTNTEQNSTKINSFD